MSFQHSVISRLLTAVAVCSLLWACSSKQEPSALIAQSERINSELDELAANSPMFIDSASCTYADAELKVNISFADQLLKAEMINDALVQVVVAQYLKGHTGINLDEVLNTLSKEQGKLVITISTPDGASKNFEIAAARLKKLVTLKPIEINYSEARLNMTDILAVRSIAYAQSVQDVQKVDFSLTGGFAQYTLEFKTPSTYASLKQSQLTGRYVRFLDMRLAELGECLPFVEQLMKDFGIEGYRFIYTNQSNSKELKAAIPWRLLNKANKD